MRSASKLRDIGFDSRLKHLTSRLALLKLEPIERRLSFPEQKTYRFDSCVSADAGTTSSFTNTLSLPVGLRVITLPSQGRETGSSPVQVTKWPVRLLVRSGAFQASQRGSIPLRATTHGEYGVMAAPETVNLLVRVRISLLAPNDDLTWRSHLNSPVLPHKHKR